MAKHHDLEDDAQLTPLQHLAAARSHFASALNSPNVDDDDADDLYEAFLAAHSRAKECLSHDEDDEEAPRREASHRDEEVGMVSMERREALRESRAPLRRGRLEFIRPW